MSTLHTQIHTTHEPENLRPDAWVPWLNSTDREQTRSMAIGKFVRERGGIAHGEELRLFVYDYQEGDPMKHPNGNPARCNVMQCVLRSPLETSDTTH